MDVDPMIPVYLQFVASAGAILAGLTGLVNSVFQYLLKRQALSNELKLRQLHQCVDAGMRDLKQGVMVRHEENLPKIEHTEAMVQQIALKVGVDEPRSG